MPATGDKRSACTGDFFETANNATMYYVMNQGFININKHKSAFNKEQFLFSNDGQPIRLDDISDNGVVNHLFLAFFYLKEQQYEKAKMEIDSLQFEETSDSEKDYFDVTDAGDEIRICKSKFYLLKGSIYTFFKDCVDSAKHFFQMYHIWQVSIDKERISENGNKHFYSFRKANKYAFSDLENNTITVSSPRKMNDPQDTLIYKWAETQACDMSGGKPVKSSLYIESLKYYRIRSFVFFEKKRNAKNPLIQTVMWAHYANCHKGFCVVYSLSPEFRAHQDDSGYRVIEKSLYKRKKVNLHSKEIDGRLALLMKSWDWEYENEYRLLTYLPNNEEDFVQIKLDDHSYISSIIFGLKCSKRSENKVRKILEGQAQIKYYRMIENKEDYYNLTWERIQ